MLVIAAAALVLQVAVPAPITASIDRVVASMDAPLPPWREIKAPSRLWHVAPLLCHLTDFGTAVAMHGHGGQEKNVWARNRFDSGRHIEVIGRKLAAAAGEMLAVKLIGKDHPGIAKAVAAGVCAPSLYGAFTNVREIVDGSERH